MANNKRLEVTLAFSADTSNAKSQLKSLQDDLGKLNRTRININDKNFDALKEGALAAGELQTHLQKAINQNTGKLDFTKLNKSLKESGITLEQYAEKLLNMGEDGRRAFNNLSNAITQSEIPLKRTNKLVDETWKNLKNAAKWQISSRAIDAFASGIRNAYGYAQDLNESLNNIRIVTGQNADQMAKFAERANKAARALSTTTTEYTDAALIYYQQGLSDAEVEERTNATVKMANVTGESAQAVSDQMTAIWNNFYDGSKSLEYYADVITELGAATASSTDEISAGLEKFASVADTVGLSYEYATSALATVTSETRQSADVVGTAFKTLFARIQDLELGETLEDGTTMGKYSEALNAVGINIKDSNGALKDMDDILDEMGSKWGTLNKDQQVALAQTVAGVRQYTQLVALMDNWGTFQENLNTARTSEGALQEQADIYEESWKAASDRVKAALESIYSDLINDEFFIDLLNALEKVLGIADNLIDSFGGLGGLIANLGAIFTQVFSKKISEGLRQSTQDVRFLLTQGKKEKAARAATLKNLDKMGLDAYEKSNFKGENEAIGKSQKEMLKLKRQMADKSSFMSESTKDQFEKDIQALRKVQDVYIGLARSVGEAGVAVEGLRNKLADSAGEGAFATDITVAATDLAKQYNNLEIGFQQGDIEAVKKTIEGLNADYKLDLDLELDQKDLPTVRKKMEEFLRSQLIPSAKVSVKLDDSKFVDSKTAAEELNEKIKEINVNLSESEQINIVTEEEIQDAESYQRKLEEIQNQVNVINAPQNQWDDIVNNNLTEYTDGIFDLAQKEQLLARAEEEATDGAKILGSELDKQKPHPADWADKITASAQAITSLMAVVTTASGIVDTWGDDTKSTGEKIGSTLTAVATTGVSAFTSLSMAATAFGFSLSAAIWPITLAVAGIAAIVVAVKLWDKAHESTEERLERLTKEQEALNKAQEDTSRRIDDVIQASNGYDEVQKKLEECTAGTEEWNKALKENNQYVLNLLSTYPELVKYMKRDPVTGAISLEDNAFDQMLEDMYALQQTQTMASYAQQAVVSEARSEQAINDFIDYDIYAGSLYNDYTDKIRDNFEELAKQAAIGDKELEDYFDSLFTEEEKAHPTFELSKQTYLNNLKNNKADLYRLANVENKEQKVAELSVSSYFADKGNPVAQAYSRTFFDDVAKEKEKISIDTLTASEIERVYGKQAGTVKKENGQIYFFNAENNEWEAQDTNVVTSTVATDRIKKEYENDTERKKAITKISSKYRNDAFLNAVIQGEDFSNVEGQLLNPRFIENISEDELNALGYTKEQLYDIYDNQVRAVNVQRSKIANDLSENFSNEEFLSKNQFSLSQLEAMQQVLDSAPKDTDLVSILEEAGSDAGEIAQAFADATSPEEIEALTDKIEENGWAIDVNSEEYKKWQQEAIKAAKAGKTYEQRLEEINTELEKYGIDEEQLTQMEDYLKEINPELAEHEEALTEVARKQLLLSTGLNDLTSNADNYKAILKTLSEEGAEALANPESLEQLNALKTSIVQILDTDPDLVDNNFLVEHLEKINRLAKGDTEALEELQKIIALNVLKFDVEIDDNELTEFENYVNSIDLDNIEVGATIETNEFFAQLINMMNEAGASVDTIQKYFNSLGFELEPITKEITVLQAIGENTTLDTNLVENSAGVKGGLYGTNWTTQPVTVFAGWKVAGKTSNNVPPPSNKKSGSSPSKKDTKDNIKADDHIDRYKEINDVLDDINDTYEKLNSQTDRYFGANRIQALKNESEALKLVNQGLRKKYDLTEQYLKSDKKALEAAGFTVDDTFGNITNYEERMKELIAGVNSAINEYNTAVNNYNGKITEDTQSEDMEDDEKAIESKQEAIDAAQEKLDNAKELISKYDESREQMEDLEKEIRNNTYALQDLNAEIVAYALEMKLLVSEIKMDEIELKLGDLEVFDSLYDMAEKVGLAADKMDLYTENLKSYSEAFLQIDSLYRKAQESGLNSESTWQDAISEGLKTAIDASQLVYDKETGTYHQKGSIFEYDSDRNIGKKAEEDYFNYTDPKEEYREENTVSQADYIKQVQESRDGIIEMLKAIQELDKEMLEYYGETLSKANEELGKFTSKMEHLTSVLNHYKSLTDMLGRPTDYESIGRMLEGQANLIRDQAEVAKATYEMYQGEVDALKADLAQAEEGTYLYEMLSRQLEEAEQAMMESQENMLAKTEEWAGLMKQILENDLAKAAQALENALTGGTSFDQLAQQWERANSLQENYLTATNQIYETTKLMRDAQKEIDKTSNEAAKKRLNAFVKETEQLRDQGKLSNYELEVQQAKYDLLLAEIALEEARNAKSMVRLQRDNEGNYGYVYTADQDKIADAEQKVDDANNKLYNISLEGQINYSQQYQGLMQEYYNALVELQTNYQNGAFESEAEYQNQKQQLLDYYNQKAAELLDIYNMATLTSIEATNDAWTTNLMDIIAKEDEWTIATQDYLIQVEDAFKNMEEAVSQVEKDLGIDFDSMESSIQGVIDKSNALKEEVVKPDTGVIAAIQKEAEAVRATTGEYGTWRTKIDETVTAAQTMVTYMNTVISNAATVTSEVNKEAKAFEDLAQAIRDVNTAKNEKPTDTTNTTDNNTDNTTPKNPDNNNNKDVPPEVQKMADSAAKLVMKVHSGDADLLAAGYIPNKNGWTTPAKKLGYSQAVIDLARKAFSESDKNSAYGYILDKALKIAGYDTGGYTGSWGTAGKLALLHEKELVLNKEDTKNLLASVQMVRDYIDSIDLNTISMLALNPYTAASLASQGAQLDQNVTIEANFPSVTDRNEIEEALKSLVNRASQYINK